MILNHTMANLLTRAENSVDLVLSDGNLSLPLDTKRVLSQLQNDIAKALGKLG